MNTQTDTPPPIIQLEFDESDFDKAEKLAATLGYEQTAYTSTSGLWGLFCLPENPEYNKGRPTRGGCIIKTKEFGLMFVQLAEEIQNQ
jgi:hypothetical protein